MNTTFTVTAIWDRTAHVFTSRSDIPGLVVEADTFEELVDLVEALAPEVIKANIPDARWPFAVSIETHSAPEIVWPPWNFAAKPSD